MVHIRQFRILLRFISSSEPVRISLFGASTPYSVLRRRFHFPSITWAHRRCIINRLADETISVLASFPNFCPRTRVPARVISPTLIPYINRGTETDIFGAHEASIVQHVFLSFRDMLFNTLLAWPSALGRNHHVFETRDLFCHFCSCSSKPSASGRRMVSQSMRISEGNRRSEVTEPQGGKLRFGTTA